MTVPDDIKNTIGKALGRVPSGLFVLCAVDDAGVPHAMLASWVQQAAFAPPSVSVALTKDRPIRAAIEATRRFAIAVLPQGDTSLLKKYARGVKPGDGAFDGIDTLATPAGLRVPATALAWLECAVSGTFDFGADHDLLVGAVTAGAVLRDGDAFRHQRGNGFHY